MGKIDSDYLFDNFTQIFVINTTMATCRRQVD